MIRTLAFSCSLVALFAGAGAFASAHPERVAGQVLTVLGDRHAIVVRCDARGSKPETTKLFKLAAGIDPASLRAGDRIVGLADPDSASPTFDEIRVTHMEIAAPSVVRPAIPLLVGDALPETRFVDQRGRSFAFSDFRGESVVLTFFYTRCRDQNECPLVSSHLRILQRRFANKPYHLVEMTIEPRYDRPAILAEYGRAYDADPDRWTLATGDPQTVLDFAARFGIDPFADPRIGLIHTERTALIGPDGKIVDFVDQANWNPDNIVARLQPPVTKPATWLERLDFELSKLTVALCGNGATGYSGLQDLAIVLAILGGVAFVLQRVARFFITH
ncbi:MAG: SCO family protein [Candidatus Eremiobacteraeota bacterium]|nr:SCO family protein [Candidatus Eremiobacteraeota bacterium]